MAYKQCMTLPCAPPRGGGTAPMDHLGTASRPSGLRGIGDDVSLGEDPRQPALVDDQHAAHACLLHRLDGVAYSRAPLEGDGGLQGEQLPNRPLQHPCLKVSLSM